MDEKTNQSRRQPEQPRPRRRRRKKRLTVWGVLLYVMFIIGSSLLLATLGWTWANDVLALNKPAHSAVITLKEDVFTEKKVTKTVETENGTETVTETVSIADLDYVTDLLKKENIIEYKFVFRMFCLLSNAERKLAPGTYEMNTDMDYRAIVTNMGSRSASRMTAKVTIPEGYTLDQTFRLLEEKGVSSVRKLTEQAASYDYKFDFLQDLPLGDAKRLEGYLFPDTYEFYLGESPKTVLNKMLVNFDNRVNKDLREDMAEKGMTLHDAVIIASLIEKETDGEDQKTISSVIQNRLNSNKTGGKLEIDATVQYALPERKEKLTLEDLEVDSPYNTYLYPGLPAGPIANPGMAAIRAAVYPEKTDYYWYVLGEDGVHHFFSNYDSFVNFKNSLK